jgi:hypothetical protein
MQSEKRTSLNWRQMLNVRTKAMRKGVWFKVLTRSERACMDLAIKVIERVRSRLLLNVLSTIMKKLEDALESPIRRLIQEIGSQLASKMSQIAQKWGNKSAARWAKELDFMLYLTIDHMNAPR